MIDNVPGDAPGMRHQKFDNFKADRIANRFEHRHQTFLLIAGNIKRTTLGRNSCLYLFHVLNPFNRIFTINSTHSKNCCQPPISPPVWYSKYPRQFDKVHYTLSKSGILNFQGGKITLWQKRYLCVMTAGEYLANFLDTQLFKIAYPFLPREFIKGSKLWNART